MIISIVKEMRVKQWTKNVLVYASLLFGGELFQKGHFFQASMAFIAFCMVSSSVYFFNDIFDLEKDKQNPKKCNRPIASGKIPLATAYACSAVLLISGSAIAYSVNASCFSIILLYALINIFYTIRLKHVVILDVMLIACGFVLRAVMGTFAVDSGMTTWFLLCVMFLSFFLALGKRRHELVALQNEDLREGRKVLQFYNVQLIDQMMTIVTASLLLCYALFAVDVNTKNNQMMMLTVPLVLYGVFYYLYMVRVKGGGGAPDESLYREKPILIVVLIYILTIVLIRNV